MSRETVTTLSPPVRHVTGAVKTLFDPNLMLAPHRGWIIWGIFACVVAAVMFHDTVASGNVVQIYRSAALRWCHGEALYDGSGSGFIYPPQSAVLFLSLAWLPHAWCGVAWRVLNIAVFALGTRRLAGLAAGDGSGRLFTLVTLIAVPLCWSAARYGQMTLFMGGLMMWAAADLKDRRWWRAAAALTLAAGVKPLAVPLLLLAAALYPRTSWRIAVWGLVVAVLPFLTQSFSYAAGEYAAAVQMVRDATDHGIRIPYSQLFWSLRVWGLSISQQMQTLIQLVVALGTFGFCAWSAWRHNRARSLLYLATLAVSYILLMNPRTENNTYALMAPALACFAALALEQRKYASAGLLLALPVCLLASHSIGKLFDGSSEVWLKPLVCTVFSIYVLCESVWQPALGTGAEDTEQASLDSDHSDMPRAA